MSNKLQIFSSYLPYGLIIYDTYDNSDYKLTGIVVGTQERIIMSRTAVEHNRLPEEIKPYLRPMSDVTKTIVHDGESIVPLVRLFELCTGKKVEDYKISFNKGHYSIYCETAGAFGYVNDADNNRNFFYLDDEAEKEHTYYYWGNVNQYQLFQYLLSLHFNVFDLPTTDFINKQ